MPRPVLALAFTALSLTAAVAQDSAKLEIVWPPAGAVIELVDSSNVAIGVVVKGNLTLVPAGSCGNNTECAQVDMKRDPRGNACNISGLAYNSMNSDLGGDLIEARFAHCPDPYGTHVFGVLLADQDHQPIIVDGEPVSALVTATTSAAK